ncbi:MAG: FKBP-type peptidyl-prolyl cis-trans isomerase SlyD [Halothiobacillaceae bacterium]|nr:MAG: FKBP-type peptidyl-prolyl cis-trans isomerase SlyD [Halothiobacillaceae bacterium]
MQITPNTVVQFNYTIRDKDGQQIESNAGSPPMAFLHGHGNVLKGIEAAMSGRVAGERFTLTLAPAEAYGERNPNEEQRIPIKYLHGAAKWKPGMIATVRTAEGQHSQVRILKAGKFIATVDGNHPLAGMALTFDIEIVAVRAATAEELAHGHAHGDGGHHH